MAVMKKEWEIGWMYIYEQQNGKLKFINARRMIGWGLDEYISDKIAGCFSEMSDPMKLQEGELVYEVWFPAYLKAHPDSESDLMVEAGITHQNAQLERV